MQFFTIYLVLSNIFGTFAAEKWNLFPLAPIISVYKRMLNLP